DAGVAVNVDADAAHVIVAARADFDAVVHEVEAILAAAINHAGEMLCHVFDVAGVDEDAAAGSAASGHDFHIAATADNVARGAFELVGRVAFHVTLAQGDVEARHLAEKAFFYDA